MLRLLRPALEGLPSDDEGFVLAGDDALVEGFGRIGQRRRGGLPAGSRGAPPALAGRARHRPGAGAGVVPPDAGVVVRRRLSALPGAEAQYLHDLARQFRFRSSERTPAGSGRRGD